MELDEQESESINSLIETDSQCIDFGTFFPGKIFKCTVRIKNISNAKRVLMLKYEQVSKFSRKMLRKEFEADSYKTFAPLFSKMDEITNSEAEHKCWHLLLAPPKTFEKHLTLALAPSQAVDVGMVIKSPQIVKGKKFCAVLGIELAQEDEKVGTLSKGEMKVMGIAEVETPGLECCKELVYCENDIRVIPLVVKLDAPSQRLKIPFKNNGSQEIDLILTIVPFPDNASRSNVERILDAEMTCVPNSCKIPAKGLGLIVINVTYQECDNLSEKKGILEREQRILIAKVKNTQMIYYFVVDCSFVL